MEPFKYTSIVEWARSQKTTMNALELADSDIPVFPCNRDKTPMTAHGFYDASTDQTRIALFFRDPAALIAMPTGLASNIDVIDEDPKNGGDLSTLGPIPMTAVARTRSGGRHVFYRHRDGVKNTTGLRQGIDVRGEGGYVVLWAHSDDGEWISGDLSSELLDFPENLDKRGTTLQRGGVDLSRTNLPQGERNTGLFKRLCSMRELNRPLEEALDYSRKVAQNSSPPFDESEAEDMAHRVYDTYLPGDYPEPEPQLKRLAEQTFHLSDMGNADRFDYLFGDRYLYVHKWNAFMVWTGKRWEPDERGEMGRLAEQMVRAIAREAADTDDSTDRKELLRHARSSEAQHKIRAFMELLKHRRTATPEDFDRDPMFLNCENGTLDLNTGMLRDHHRGDRITKLAPVKYEPQAVAPTFDQFLEGILPSEGVRKFVQRLTGYALNGKTSEKALPILHGGGDNGKSTLLNAVMEMFGDYGLQASNDLLMGQSSHPTEVADLYRRRFVTNVETEEGRRLREGLVKQLTGGDSISARRMRENPWTFWPTHTLFMATNHKPEIKGTDNAIWNRIKLIPFTVSIPKSQQDRELPEKLRDELPGILAWAVRGHMDWLNDGLQEPDEVKAATDSYRSDMDVLAGFFGDECVVHPATSEQASKLYRAYTFWCDEMGEKPMTQTKFGNALGERGFSKSKKKTGWFYSGIGLHDKAVTPEDEGVTGDGCDPISGINTNEETSRKETPKSRHYPEPVTKPEITTEKIEQVRKAMLDYFDERAIPRAEPETLAQVLYESGSLSYRPTTEQVEAARRRI